MSQAKPTVAHIYNPANQSEQELIANFVVRRKEFQRLFEDIKTAPMTYPEQHYVIQGPRGSGKTTLLLRLYYEIQQDKELKQRMIPVMFSEEQYFIRTLDRLWEAVLEEIEAEEPSSVHDPVQSYLDEEEHVFLLLSLSQAYQQDAVAEIVKNQRGRVEILRRLTGGIPRTIVLLFEIFAEDHNGDSFKDLEAVLDRVTPLYKHRMDDLSHDQQAIVDAIAINWDGMTFDEVLEKVRMERELVKEQLRQLVKNRIVQMTPTPAKNQIYHITERFFNIWYLMRCGRRRDKNRVIWLVKFLQNWCCQEELVSRAEKFMTVLNGETYHPRHAFYMAEALAQSGLPHDVQHNLIEKTRSFLVEKDQSLLEELSKSDIELWDEAIAYGQKQEWEQQYLRQNDT